MRYKTTVGRAVHAPYVAETAVAVGAKWSFKQHAFLAYALVSSDALIPKFGPKNTGEQTDTPVFSECIRQCSLRAIEAYPDHFFSEGAHSIEQRKAAFRAQAKSVHRDTRRRVADAIGQADRVICSYFDPSTPDPAEAEGGRAIRQIIENKEEYLFKAIEKTYRVN